MSIFGKSVKVAGKVLTGPAKFLYPKTAQNTGKTLFNYDNRVSSIYCPRCGESYLKLYDNESVPNVMREDTYSFIGTDNPSQTVYWGCPECTFCFAASTESATPRQTIEHVKEFVRQTSRQELMGDNDISDDYTASIMANQMKLAYLFFSLASGSSMLLLYGVMKGSWFFCITITLFIATFIMIGLKWSYRAWQLHTENLYADDAKAQFFDWLSNNNPLKHPAKSSRHN